MAYDHNDWRAYRCIDHTVAGEAFGETGHTVKSSRQRVFGGIGHTVAEDTRVHDGNEVLPCLGLQLQLLDLVPGWRRAVSFTGLGQGRTYILQCLVIHHTITIQLSTLAERNDSACIRRHQALVQPPVRERRFSEYEETPGFRSGFREYYSVRPPLP